MFQPSAMLTQAGPQSDTAIAFADRAGAVTGNILSLGDFRGFFLFQAHGNQLLRALLINPAREA
ncbi:hypothetical protein [Citrobacter amalonaticus]|uniref:hypothetical protein n=1 Tax=Citrobacter amalonaticus TaxID=35703 RepID=UPI00224EE9CA|nr:hypothetical protein [Citrobacter amalonaticus]MCX3397297.1 hypothetical protein [Citrobacter amalonaticus]MDQ2176597.1 hypothetical protein [Citrobacter amalonaticus]HCB3268490.1 hypothetical protein [Citrobacter amalonaticus]